MNGCIYHYLEIVCYKQLQIYLLILLVYSVFIPMATTNPISNFFSITSNFIRTPYESLSTYSTKDFTTKWVFSTKLISISIWLDNFTSDV